MPIFWRLFLANGAALLVAFGLLIAGAQRGLGFSAAHELGIAMLGLAGVLLVNAAVTGQSLGGLHDLRAAFASDDEETVEVPAGIAPEVADLATAYNRMLGRLEDERTATARAALAAQEEERQRLAIDLHDEVGQNLTFLLLRLKGVTESAPAGLRDDLMSVSDAARLTLAQVRSLSRQLRPSVLHDLGLKPALVSLVDEVRALGLQATLTFEDPLPADAERDLAIYRIVQEALTNVVKHADAVGVRVVVAVEADRVRVTVTDNGHGRAGASGTGTASMRERARLIGGTFARTSVPHIGTEVTVVVPVNLHLDADAPPPTRPIPTLTLLPTMAWQPTVIEDAD